MESRVGKNPNCNAVIASSNESKFLLAHYNTKGLKIEMANFRKIFPPPPTDFYISNGINLKCKKSMRATESNSLADRKEPSEKHDGHRKASFVPPVWPQ